MNKFRISLIIVFFNFVFAVGVFVSQAEELSLSITPISQESREKAILLALSEIEKKMSLSPPASSQTKTTAEESLPEEINKATTKQKKSPYIGGAWGMPKGQYMLELYSKYYYHNRRFDNNGNKNRWGYNGKGNELTTEFKIEYGFSDDLTIWTHIPYKHVHWKDDYATHSTKGLADIWLGGKYRFLEKPVVLSLGLLAKLPAGYNENDIPSLGNGQIDEEIRLLSAKSFPALGYIKAETGYRWRNEEPADTIAYFFEFGYQALDKLLVKTTLDGAESLKIPTGEDYTKWTTSMLFTLRKAANPFLDTTDKLEFEIGYGETFAGKNASAASEIFSKILYYF